MMPLLPEIVHFAATWFMTGLIWLIQIVHYPIFGAIPDPHSVRDAQQFHLARITFVVAPPMLIELASALFLLVRRPSSLLAWSGAALLAVIWLSTVFIQVPQHAALADNWNSATHAALVRANWLRTIAWTLRGLLAAALVLTPATNSER